MARKISGPKTITMSTTINARRDTGYTEPLPGMAYNLQEGKSFEVLETWLDDGVWYKIKLNTQYWDIINEEMQLVDGFETVYVAQADTTGWARR